MANTPYYTKAEVDEITKKWQSGQYFSSAFSTILDFPNTFGSIPIDWNICIKHKITLFNSVAFNFINYENFEEIKVHCLEISSPDPNFTVTFPAGVDIAELDNIDFSTPNMHNFISIRYLGNDKFQVSNYVKEILP